MDTTAPSTPRQVAGLTSRMLDAGRDPEFIIAYIVQRGGEPRSVRAGVQAAADLRRAARRTRRLRLRALALESTGAALTLLGAGVAWEVRTASSPWMGPAVVLAGVGYLIAWRGLTRWLGAGRTARREVQQQRSILGKIQV